MNSREAASLDRHITGNFGEDQFQGEVKPKKAPRIPKWFCWTVKIKVEKSWVADGFDLTNERAHSMLANSLPFANNSEIAARVTSKPKRQAIRKAQGY